MPAPGNRPIIISPTLAALLSTIMAGSVLAGIGYAWNSNADLAVLQRDVKQIKDANLEVRISVMEQTVRGMAESMARVENKLDKLLERK